MPESSRMTEADNWAYSIAAYRDLIAHEGAHNLTGRKAYADVVFFSWRLLDGRAYRA